MNRAIIAYESTLRLRPRCAEAWNNMGVLHREQHNVERAAGPGPGPGPTA